MMFGGSALEQAKRMNNPRQWVWDAEDRVERAKKELRDAEAELAAAKRTADGQSAP